MEEIKIDDIMDMVEFDNKTLCKPERSDNAEEEEEIRIYVPPRDTRRIGPSFLRFLLLTAVFLMLFLIMAFLIEDRKASQSEDTDGYHQAVAAPENGYADETTAEYAKAPSPPIVIDESKIGIEIKTKNDDYSLTPLIEASDGVKVLIVHSHNSESVSDTISVTDAGRVISQILTSAGIETYHSIAEHDAEGNIGAYSKMNNTVSSLIEKYPNILCVIDIHDSDSGLPLTFTVATDGDGWTENLLLAEAIGGRMEDAQTAFRFLPGALGQDSGVLTLNVGICGKGYEDSEARDVIASFAEAFIEICSKKASASP